MTCCRPDQYPFQGKLALMVALTPVVCLVGLGGLTVHQARAATASASATVIDPVNVTTSVADLPVTVSRSGGWIKVVMPPAQPPPPVSRSSSGGSSAGAAVASPALDGASLTLESFKQLAASDGTVQGDTVSALSLLAPTADAADGGSYSVTVAFN